MRRIAVVTCIAFASACTLLTDLDGLAGDSPAGPSPLPDATSPGPEAGPAPAGEAGAPDAEAPSYLFVAGGTTLGEQRTQRSHIAPILADGSLGAWAEGPITPALRYRHGLVADAQSFYLVGGFGADGNATPTIYRSRMGVAPEAFMALPELPELVSDICPVVLGSRLYVIGASFDTALIATMTGDGLGGFQKQATLAAQAYYGSAVVAQDRIFVFGNAKRVLRSEISANGALAGWVTLADMPIAFDELSGRAASDGVHVFLLGGPIGSDASNQVFVATVDANGGVGSFQPTEPFITPRLGFSVVVHNGYLYVVGGESNGGESVLDVTYTKIGEGGMLAPWRTTSALPLGRREGCVATALAR